MSRVYGFSEQKTRGAAGEAFLDAFFVEKYHIWPAADGEQRRGIDRFTNRETGAETAVEHKTDYRASGAGLLRARGPWVTR